MNSEHGREAGELIDYVQQYGIVVHKIKLEEKKWKMQVQWGEHALSNALSFVGPISRCAMRSASKTAGVACVFYGSGEAAQRYVALDFLHPNHVEFGTANALIVCYMPQPDGLNAAWHTLFDQMMDQCPVDFAREYLLDELRRVTIVREFDMDDVMDVFHGGHASLCNDAATLSFAADGALNVWVRHFDPVRTVRDDSARLQLERVARAALAYNRAHFASFVYATSCITAYDSKTEEAIDALRRKQRKHTVHVQDTIESREDALLAYESHLTCPVEDAEVDRLAAFLEDVAYDNINDEMDKEDESAD